MGRSHVLIKVGLGFAQVAEQRTASSAGGLMEAPPTARGGTVTKGASKEIQRGTSRVLGATWGVNVWLRCHWRTSS